MGGFGSGRYSHCSTKRTTDEFLVLDIRKWGKELMVDGRKFSSQWSRNGHIFSAVSIYVEDDRVILKYTNKESNGELKDYNYPVLLSWSECNYGGTRPWFLCPAEGCGRRVAVLYGGAIFACRKCYDIAYKSQRESPSDRPYTQINKIREKLGWKPGLLGRDNLKPNGMHWNTFIKLVEEYKKLINISTEAIDDRIAKWGMLTRQAN